MPPDRSASRAKGAPTTAALRRLLAERVALTSLRRVAEEVGMSPNGLRSFLLGGEPYAATRRKLLAWHLRAHGAHGAGEPTDTAAAAALEVLTAHLPAGKRAAAKRRIAEAVGGIAGDQPQPGWVRQLAEAPQDPVER